MWKIYEHKNVDKQLKSTPREILKKYEKWKDIVAISGPDGLKLIRRFHGEALSGEWHGHRCSRLGCGKRICCIEI